MKKIILISCLGWALSFSSYGQEGFNKIYGEDWVGGIFTAVELIGDTVYVFGTAIEQDEPMWGFLVGRLDTLGNLLDYHIHYDQEGNEFASNISQRSIVKLSDGSGFAMAGSFFYQYENYFIKLNDRGEITFIRRYIDDRPEYSFNRFSQIVEVEDGFLIQGTRTLVSLNQLHVFVIRVDKDGEIIWEMSFLAPNERNFLGSIVVKDSTDFLITGITFPFHNLPHSQRYYTTLMFSFNLDGKELWSFESGQTTEEQGAFSVEFTKEGNYIYPSLKPFYNEEFNGYEYQPIIVIRDPDFNLIETNYFHPIHGNFSQITGFIKLEEGSWLSLGMKPYEYPREPYFTRFNAISGWMMRFDEDTGTVWSRVDTARWSPTYGGARHFLRDAVILPSGSIIACGYHQDHDLFRDFPWLIKVDKDGCMYSGDCGTFITNVEEIVQDMEMEISIYPNPAADKLNILIEEEIPDKDLRVQVYNMAGKLVYSVIHQTKDIQLDISSLPSAPYNLIIIQGQKVIGGKKILVQR